MQLRKVVLVLAGTLLVAQAAVVRLSLAPADQWHGYSDWEPSGPGTYAFGYDVDDPASDNVQFRDEQRFPNGTVAGSYGYIAPGGLAYTVHYIADHLGYRARVHQQPSSIIF